MIRLTARLAVKPAPLAGTRRGMQTFDLIESQVNVLRNGKTVVTQGRGGRSSRSGYTVTVFGASGLIGTEVTQRLARHGTLVIAPYRDEHFQRHLKLSGDLGVVNPKEFDLRNIESIEHAVQHSDVVVNLIGRDWPTKNFSFDDVNVEGARRIAAAATKFGVPRLIHVSSHSAAADSPSGLYRSKALGEDAVKAEYPDVTIVRPGPVFGPQDHFLDRLAPQRITLHANHGKETYLPTYIKDLGVAITKMIYDDSTTGQLYELNGPDRVSVYEVWQQAKEAVKRDRQFWNLPKPLLKAWATFLNYSTYWHGVTTVDEIERMFIDQVVTPETKGYADLGITPQRLYDHLLPLVHHYRPSQFMQDSRETDVRRKKDQESVANIVD